MNIWIRRREGRERLLRVTVPSLLLYLISIPPLGFLALGTLEWPYPPSDKVPDDAGAIVVLAGSVHAPDRVRDRPELGSSSLYRCLHAVRLYRTAGPRPILVSGGSPEGGSGPSYARTIADFLVEQNVDSHDILIEESSKNTYENAIETCRILRRLGIRRVVLVTEASHMRRASWCFRGQGVLVTPSPCHHRATEFHLAPRDLVPDHKALSEFETALHEWLGLLYYRMRSGISHH